MLQGRPCTVGKDVSHPSMVRISAGEFISAYRCGVAGSEDAIHHAENMLQV